MRNLPLAGSALALLLALSPAASGQVAYCKEIGNNKTYCSGGTIIHRQGNTTVITNSGMAPRQVLPTLPNPLMQNNSLPALDTPPAAAGIQGALPALPAPTGQIGNAAAQPAPVIVLPPAGSRICHQFGTTLVCN